jgi:hypothetical protein
MSMFGSLEEIWRRSLDLNLRYYGAMGQLTADYVKDLANTLSEVRLRQTPDASATHEEERVQPPPGTAAAGVTTTQQTGAMVLEGESGRRVLGVFLVENHLNRDISARVVASSFVAANGDEVKPAMVFDPELIALGPGEQSLVRVVVFIDDTLDLEVRYVGQFTIPELTGTRIPVVLRRRLNQDVVSVSAFEGTGTARKTGSRAKKSGGRQRAKKGQPSAKAKT